MASAEPVSIPLTLTPGNRDLSTEWGEKIVNGYHDALGDRVVVAKRPGIAQVMAPGHGAPRGSAVLNGSFNVVLGGEWYYCNGGDTSLSPVGAVGAVGYYSFALVPGSIALGAVGVIIAGNDVFGAETYLWNGTDFTTVTGTNLPSLPARGIICIDQTTYRMGQDGVVYGSAFGDPSDWTDTTNFVDTTGDNQQGIYLTTQLNYAVAMNAISTSFLYDAGNPTGSPLAFITGAYSNIGWAAAASVQNFGDIIIGLAQTKSGKVFIGSIQNLAIKPISTPPIEKLIAGVTTLGDIAIETYTIYSWQGFFGAHRVYALTIVERNLTLVFDLDMNKWYQWMDGNGNYIPLMDGGQGFSHTTHSAESWLMGITDGNIYTLDPLTFVDAGGPFLLELVTSNFDGKTRFSKSQGRLDLVADQVSGGVATIEWSDDDYKTWSKPEIVALGDDWPHLIALGQFRRRAFRVRDSGATLSRMERLDLYAGIGAS